MSLSSIGNSEAASLFSTAAIFGVIAVIGILLYMVGKSSAKKNSGMILLSLSILMSGMRAMSDAMEPLQHNATFLHAMSVVSNPLLCILIGIVVTAVVQSCSASIGILQALAVTGVIEFRIAVYMVVGMSVGACVPVLISSIGASLEAKRTAFTYLYFDAIAGVVFCVLFAILDAFTGIFSVLNGPASSVMITMSLYRVVELIRSEAASVGVSVKGVQMSGVFPTKVLLQCADHYLHLLDFQEHQLLEHNMLLLDSE